MNKFGDKRGYGLPGPAGRDGFDMTGWTPAALLQMFRQSTDVSFYFKTETDCILYDDKHQPIGLKNHGNSAFNAICLENFHKPVRVHGSFYALPLDHTIYRISGIRAAQVPPTICFVAFTFKISKELEPGKEYTIFTNDTGTRGVVISRKTINILGTQVRQELTYASNEYNTMLIQWSNVSYGEDKCFFYLNDRRGFIRPQKYKDDESTNIFIGGHPTRGECAPIYLTRFDIYERVWDTIQEENYLVPEGICKLILDDIMIDDM